MKKILVEPMTDSKPLILQCPRCDNVIDWDRSISSKPGQCSCGAYAPWKILKERPSYGCGHVVVISNKGWEQLHGPYYREKPDAWKKGPFDPSQFDNYKEDKNGR